MDAKLFVDLLPEFEDTFFVLDIHTAASIGCDERVMDIIESEGKAIVDKRNKKGWTPLMYAASCANLKVVLLLLEEDAEPDIKNFDGQTSLILASKCGSGDVVDLLIEHGAFVNEIDFKGWTALFYAVAFGHKSVMQLLIEKGAVIDIVDVNQRTPLMLAAASGNERIVQDLLQLNGAFINEKDIKGWTALYYAISYGYRSIMKLLIERGALFDIVDDDGRTPLTLAMAAGHDRIVQDLLQLRQNFSRFSHATAVNNFNETQGINTNIECMSGDAARSLSLKNGQIIDSSVQTERNAVGPNTRCPDLFSLLTELQLTKYYHLFEHHGIVLNTFWQLTDDDLKRMGIQLLGPRKKICTAISQYQQEQSQETFPKETANPDSILMENKKLLIVTEKLKSMVLEEKNSKIAVEQNLAECLQNIKRYDEMLNATLGREVEFLQKLKENQDYLRSLFCSTFQDLNFSNSGCLKVKIDSIFKSLDCIQKLMEIQQEQVSSLHQCRSDE